MPERVLSLSRQVSSIATARVEEIRKATGFSRILGLNAAIEAARARNPGFGVVAAEVGKLSKDIERLAQSLSDELSGKTVQLEELGRQLVANIRGSRLADLALNMIDIIDRNLYERSCDVRWWATDSALVECAAGQTVSVCDHASSRLGVILDSYTVYLDLWIAAANGTVIANGRPRQYPVRGFSVAGEDWFRKAMTTTSGTGFAACDVGAVKQLGGASVATYATAVRADGRTEGKAIGALGIFFDWQNQSQLVVDSVRLADREKAATKCMIADAAYKVIASSDRADIGKVLPLRTDGRSLGSYEDQNGDLIAFALTPGYETYKGMGWYGVLAQTRAENT